MFIAIHPATYRGGGFLAHGVLKRFYAGCQPRYPSGYLRSHRYFKTPVQTHHFFQVWARYPSKCLASLANNMRKHSTAFTCRYTEPFGSHI